MKVEKKLTQIGSSLGIILSQDQVNHIGGKKGDIIIVMDDERKHGEFISLWKKKQEE